MPDAPPPTFNSAGVAVADWLMVCRYDAAKDVITISWVKEPTSWNSRAQGATSTPGTALDQHLAAVSRITQELHSLRLF